MQYYAESNTGFQRKINEDNFCCGSQNGGACYYFAVADGMGGYKAGEIASKIAVDTLCDSLPEITFGDNEVMQDILTRLFGRTNMKIRENARSFEEQSDMGTTEVICFVDNQGRYAIGNVGDSRAYLISEGSMNQITTDHSYVEYLVKTGMIDRETAENHPDKNMLTKALGKDENAEPDVFYGKMKKGDRLLLCTDGLSNMVSGTDIFETVNNRNLTPEKICHLLVKKANDGGGADNITVIVAEF